MNIELLKSSYHTDIEKSFKFTFNNAEIYLGSFNKTEEGGKIQVTVVRSNNAHTCYVHFTKEQCTQLAKLMELSINNL